MSKRKKINSVKTRLSFDDAKQIAEEIEQDKQQTIIKSGGGLNEKMNIKQRVKFTTTLNPELKEELKHISIKEKCTISDVLERAVIQYLDGRK